MYCYDVALWPWWPAPFPQYASLVEASHAFAAIEQVMCLCGLRRVAYASARALDGSLVYRACQVSDDETSKMCECSNCLRQISISRFFKIEEDGEIVVIA